uniref:Uncharacterized protein n=1 Tax=Brassica oleracea var. oleracea TaxID=109376 RepID=A0A0D2ZV85_BRAOL
MEESEEESEQEEVETEDEEEEEEKQTGASSSLAEVTCFLLCWWSREQAGNSLTTGGDARYIHYY